MNSLCAWDKGLSIVPENTNYCAPTMMTDDVEVIMGCISAHNFSSCQGPYGVPGTAAAQQGPPQCMWRRGRVVANNTYVNQYTRELFKTNICHPKTTQNWNETAQPCMSKDTEATCPSSCTWSTMQEFLPTPE